MGKVAGTLIAPLSCYDSEICCTSYSLQSLLSHLFTKEKSAAQALLKLRLSSNFCVKINFSKGSNFHIYLGCLVTYCVSEG